MPRLLSKAGAKLERSHIKIQGRTLSKANILFFMAGALLILAPTSSAGLRDIRTDKLPRDVRISEAYSNALKVESMTREWHDVWRFSTPKEEVAALLKTNLAKLQAATSTASDNEELWLLTGIVAHYAYNVDVDGSYEVAEQSLKSAQKLAPDDYRPTWFRASLTCQTPQSRQGMESFLSIESRFSWKNLPIDFWDDYLSCTTITAMPAHSLRAGDHLRKLDPPSSDYRNSLLDIAQNRMKKPELSRSYSQQEVWSFTKRASVSEYVNTMFGIRFSVPNDWNLRFLDIQNGQSLVQIQMAPFHAAAGDIRPNILIIIRPPKSGETINDFVKAIMKYPSASPAKISNCPSDSCFAIQGKELGTYGAAGDGYGTITGFQREQPEFPGIKFEEPLGVPEPTSNGPQYFRPTQRISRIPGTLYYLVLLDTAGSVRDEANSAYTNFLKRVVVE